MRLLIVLILTATVSSCNFGTNKNNGSAEKQSLYENVIKSGQIRVGYISYPPSYIVNPDGSQSGIFHEVMEEVGKNLGLKINYTKEVTWDGMIQDLKENKVDMIVTGIWPTTQRGKQADFAAPLFYSVVKAYTYYGNNQFDNNLSRINDTKVKISTIDGEMTQIIAAMDFPKAKQVPVTQLGGVPQVLLEIRDKKADVTFVEPYLAMEFMEKNPNSIREIEGVSALRVFPNCMMLPKGEEEFKSTINIALQELINNGYVDKIISKYEKYPHSYYRALPQYKVE